MYNKKSDIILEWTYNYRGVSRDFIDGAGLNFKNSIESLIRESIQNSNDARNRALEKDYIEENTPTEVKFQLHEIFGEERRKFLKQIDRGNNFSKHLKVSKMIKTEYDINKYFNSRINIGFEFMVIHDFNTIGLMGDELPSGDKDSPFSALCRDRGMTNKGNVESKGGSYGLGKSVFWKFSEFNTVLFLSYTEHPEIHEMQYRFFGRADIGAHEIGNINFKGIVDFGIKVKREDVEYMSEDYAQSYWVKDLDQLSFLPKAIRDLRKNKRGTSIIILGYSEFLEHKENCSNLKNEIFKWYWPLIARHDLNVRILNGTKEIELNISEIPDNYKPFQDIFLESKNYYPKKSNNSLKVDEKSVEFPKKESNGQLESEAVLVMKNADDYSYNPISEKENHIALMRGTYTVVKYQPIQNPLGNKPYFGLLFAGLALNHVNYDVDNINEFDDFLRFAETPSHDDWNYKKSQLKEEYGSRSGASKLLAKMNKNFKDLKFLIAENLTQNRSIPAVLMNLLPGDKDSLIKPNKFAPPPSKSRSHSGGSTPKRSTPKRTSNMTVKNKFIERKNDRITAKFNVKRNDKDKPFKVKITPKILDENRVPLGDLISSRVVLEYDYEEIVGTTTYELTNDEYDITVSVTKIPKEFRASEISLSVVRL